MTPRSRREFLKAAGGAIAALTLPGCAFTSLSSTVSERERPNIIFILADDLGYGDLGCYGSPDIKTPHINRMAENGMKFTDFYVNAPVCSPARAAFLTGRSPQRCGVETVLSPGNLDNGLPLNETTLAELLQRGRYATGIFGKWHLGYADTFNPVSRGFDRFIGHLSGFLDYHSHVNPALGYDWMDGLETIEGNGYSTDLIGKHSIEFVKANKEKPFFMFVSHQAPHSPYQGPADKPQIESIDGCIVKDTIKLDSQQRYAKYIEMVEHMDTTIGDLLNVLEQEELSHRTLVVFVSDNGPSYLSGTTDGLRGGKHNLWEGGIRVPAVACWPGNIRPGSVSSQPATMVDLFPTFLGLAGIKQPDNLALDGMDLGKLLLEQKPLPNRTLCWRYSPQSQVAVRRGRWKLMGRYNKKTSQTEFNAGVVTLYDLSADPAEEHDLSAQFPEIVAELAAAHDTWEKGIATDSKRRERTRLET